MALYQGIFLGFFKTFSEESVDQIIYRDDIANRHSFIYCSLACTQHWCPGVSGALSPVNHKGVQTLTYVLEALTYVLETLTYVPSSAAYKPLGNTAERDNAKQNTTGTGPKCRTTFHSGQLHFNNLKTTLGHPRAVSQTITAAAVEINKQQPDLTGHQFCPTFF